MRHRVTIVRVEPIGDGPDGSVFFRLGSAEYEAFAMFVEDFRAEVGRTIDVELHAMEIEILSWLDDEEPVRCGVTRALGWDYHAYAIVRSLRPMVLDFGDLRLDADDPLDDPGRIGRALHVKIHRLGIDDWLEVDPGEPRVR